MLTNYGPGSWFGWKVTSYQNLVCAKRFLVIIIVYMRKQNESSSFRLGVKGKNVRFSSYGE